MDAFRSREDALAARNAELEAALAAERARADAAEKVAATAQAFDGATDIHVGLSRGLLWVSFVGYLFLVLISFPAYIAIARDEAHLPQSSFYAPSIDPTLIGIGMALVIDLFCAPVGVGALVGAIGLRRGKRWGYVAAVIAFAAMLLFCMPVGAYGVWALLRERVRNVFFPPAPLRAVASPHYQGPFQGAPHHGAPHHGPSQDGPLQPPPYGPRG